MTVFFFNFGKMYKFRSLSPELQVSEFMMKSWSRLKILTRSVSKVTVSTTSLIKISEFELPLSQCLSTFSSRRITFIYQLNIHFTEFRSFCENTNATFTKLYLLTPTNDMLHLNRKDAASSCEWPYN